MTLNATIFGQALAFLLFVLFCMRYVWPPLIQAIEARQKEIADSLACAERSKQKLALAETEAALILQEVKLEAKQLLANAEAQRSELLDKARQDAQVLRKQLMNQLSLELAAERSKTHAELTNEIGKLVVLGVERVLGKVIDQEVQNRLVAEFIEELQTSSGE